MGDVLYVMEIVVLILCVWIAVQDILVIFVYQITLVLMEHVLVVVWVDVWVVLLNLYWLFVLNVIMDIVWIMVHVWNVMQMQCIVNVRMVWELQHNVLVDIY